MARVHLRKNGPRFSLSQINFNLSQLIQIIIYTISLSLVWSGLNGKLDNVILAVRGVYTKAEVDVMRVASENDRKEIWRHLHRINKRLGLDND